MVSYNISDSGVLHVHRSFYLQKGARNRMYPYLPDFSCGIGFPDFQCALHGYIPNDRSIVCPARSLAVETRCNLMNPIRQCNYPLPAEKRLRELMPFLAENKIRKKINRIKVPFREGTVFIPFNRFN
jgi:hypothetical protein